jgi:1-acyl-sn-glycerol-3-phosphate acyltransferase
MSSPPEGGGPGTSGPGPGTQAEIADGDLAHEIPVPSDEDLALLEPFERHSFEMVRWLSRGRSKTLSTAFLHHIGSSWIYAFTRNLHVLDGVDELRLDPDERVLLVANHRSFFDLYLILTVLRKRVRYKQRLFFPVRADFFYERPLGVLINALVGGFSMYPPIFRQPEKRDFNRYAMRETLALMRTPGVLIGFHPEGRRGKGDDPYTFLPAQPGVGEICYKARPKVLPVFINGLSNDIVGQVRSNFDGTGGPISIVVGDPLDLGRFYAQSPRLATYKRLADHFMEEIGELAERERTLRAAALREPRFRVAAARAARAGTAPAQRP